MWVRFPPGTNVKCLDATPILNSEGSEDVIMVYGTSTTFSRSLKVALPAKSKRRSCCRNRGGDFFLWSGDVSSPKVAGAIQRHPKDCKAFIILIKTLNELLVARDQPGPASRRRTDCKQATAR